MIKHRRDRELLWFKFQRSVNVSALLFSLQYCFSIYQIVTNQMLFNNFIFLRSLELDVQMQAQAAR
jgi:hypothetical protein